MLNVIDQQKKKLDDLFRKVETIDDLEMRSEWVQYLCVRTSGFLEEAVRVTLEDYAEEQSHPFVSNYVSSQLRYFSNPKTGRIVSIIRSFHPDWGDRFETEMQGELKDAVNSIVANRHQIAHGQSVSLSYIRMKDFYTRAYRAVRVLQSIVDP